MQGTITITGNKDKNVRIEAAALGNQAAMYGCAYEALRQRKEHLGE